MAQNRRFSYHGQYSLVDVFLNAEFFRHRRQSISVGGLRRTSGNHLLVELFTARNVLLRHDRFPGGVLSKRVWRIVVLPDCDLFASIRCAVFQLAGIRGGDSATPRAVDSDLSRRRCWYYWSCDQEV